MDTRKLITVCMPVHEMRGFDPFLRQSFNILTSQTFKDFDIVISDHSKKYNIKNICDEYRDKLDIKYFRNLKGPYTSGNNTNNALALATGKLLKVLFLDDFLYHKDALKDIAENFDLEKDHWLVTASEHTYDGVNYFMPFYPRYHDQIHLGDNYISSPSVLTIKNEKPLMQFDKRMVWLMDVDFYKRFHDKFGPPKILNKINVVNRNGPHQQSATVAGKTRRAIEYVWVLKKHKEKALLKEYRKKIMFRTSMLPRFIKKPLLAVLKIIGFKDVEKEGIIRTFKKLSSKL